MIACVNGGSNAIGIFDAFISEESVALIGVEAGGRGNSSGNHAATLALGRPGILHGSRSLLLQDEDGQVSTTHSVAAGLDYPGVGPEHAYLQDIGRATYVSVTDAQAMEALRLLAKTEGIIAALESAHAVAYAVELATRSDPNEIILVNLSGRGDKDMETIAADHKSRI